MTPSVRPFTSADLPAARDVIGANGLFPPDLLDGMAAAFLAGEGDEFWLAAETDGPVGLAYCAPERMTSGTWNLLLIAVRPDQQGRGIGAVLMRAVECRLGERSGRLLLVETSGLPEYERTRRFYRSLGYDEEACIREFYAAGEDKIVFRKAVPGAPA